MRPVKFWPFDFDVKCFWSFAPFFCVLFCFNDSLKCMFIVQVVHVCEPINTEFSRLLLPHSYLMCGCFFRMQIMNYTHVTYLQWNIEDFQKITANEIIEIELESRCHFLCLFQQKKTIIRRKETLTWTFEHNSVKSSKLYLFYDQLFLFSMITVLVFFSVCRVKRLFFRSIIIPFNSITEKKHRLKDLAHSTVDKNKSRY